MKLYVLITARSSFFFHKFMQNFDMIKYCLFKTNGLGNPVTAVSLMLLLSANLLRVH